MPFQFPLNHVPFSLYGSYLSISCVEQGVHQAPSSTERIYLRSHHGGGRSVLRLEATLGGDVLKLRAEASPTVVRLSHPQGFVEICFGGADTLRFRGEGLGLRLSPLLPTVAYVTDADSVTLNILALRSQYRVSALAGTLAATGLYRAGPREGTPEVSVDVAGEAPWEVALDVFGSTFTSPPRPPFEVCAAENREAFEQFLGALPEVPPDFAEARRLAAYVLYASVVAPSGLFKRPVMLMSKNWMDYVWSWDHCFNALALAPGHPELAWDQFLLMSDQQDEHGAYPDAYNDQHAIYNFSKPPVHGLTALELLNRADPPAGTLRAAYDSLAAWTSWWLSYRVLPGERLPYYLHGNDSGWDNSTLFDQGVPLMSPDLSSYLILQLEALATLANHLGLKTSNWSEQAKRLLDALVTELWQGERFVGKLATGETVTSQTLLHHMPIVLGRRLPSDILAKLKENISAFVTDHGLATEEPSSALYRPDGYWRGPMWAPSTYLVVKGLRESGFDELANTIAGRFCATCARSGFAENFDALTGEGLRDRAYTWTASVFLLLAECLN